MFVARDKDNTLTLFNSKPIRGDEWYSSDNEPCIGFIPSSLFPDLKWEDEPIEVFLNTGYSMDNQINQVWAMLKSTQDELTKAYQTISYYRTKFEAIKKVIEE